MSPMLQKELRSGLVNVPLLKMCGKWVNVIPPFMLKDIGLKIASHIKKVSQAEYVVLKEMNAKSR